MLLVNAVAFDAEWQKKYEPEDVHKNIFNSIDGTKDSVDFMFSTEGTTISDDTATGFIKYYQGGEYAFAAILPDEELSLKEYVNSLTPEKFSKLLESKTNEELIRAGMPKFSYDYSSKLNDSLISMGMPSAFDGDLADFGRMFDRSDPNFNNPYIDYVLHKTHIDVDEEGTRAAAATVVSMKDCAVLVPEKKIILDRPFMYAIIDTKTNIPVFIGSVTNFE
jgi:serpin B